ncbi:MAG: dihydrofolate reductase [Firmicutes bacterium]|nr:dihydrofolate reductase [Bacillota bacterium]
MIAIAVVDKDLAIGNKGGLLFRLPEDLKHYKQETLGRLIVMGRKTVEGLPGGRPLPGRTTVVISRSVPIPELPDDAVICGGESIYRLFWDRTDYLIMTEVEAKAEEADAHFPEYRDGSFVCVRDSGPIEDNGYTYHIREYKRVR